VIVVFGKRFRRQLDAAIRWRQEHRAPWEAIETELTWLTANLPNNPEMWPLAENARRPGLHRAYLPRIEYHVYYRIHARLGEIELTDFRHAKRRPVRM
jgi:hypothetical protein